MEKDYYFYVYTGNLEKSRPCCVGIGHAIGSR